MQVATRILFSDEFGCIQFDGHFDIEEQQDEGLWHTKIALDGGLQVGPNSQLHGGGLNLDDSFAVALTDTAVVAAGPVDSVSFDPEEQKTLVWGVLTPSDGTVTGNPDEEIPTTTIEDADGGGGE